MKQETDYYETLSEIQEQQGKPLVFRIQELKKLLQTIAKDHTDGEGIQFSTLFSRLDFIKRKFPISPSVSLKIGNFRYEAKSNEGIKGIKESEFYGHCITIGNFINELTGEPVPAYLSKYQEKATYKNSEDFKTKDFYSFVRGIVTSVDKDFVQLESDEDSIFKLQISSPDLSVYQETFKVLTIGSKVALIDLKVDTNDVSHPLHIVLEPDYLIDVSSLAECFQSLAGHAISPWQSYFIGKFTQKESTIPIHKGNLANSILDDLIFSNRNELPAFNNLILKSFKNYPFEYTFLFPEQDQTALRTFIAEVEIQYANLQRVIQIDFENPSISITKEQVLLEPSFICEKLGVQGRMDLIHTRDSGYKIIELKSGKVPFPANDPQKISDNHSAQARLYRLLINQIFSIKQEKIEAAICYSAATTPGENIRWVPTFIDFDKRILNTRNQIISIERRLSMSESDEDIFKILADLSFDALGIDLHPNLGWFRAKFDELQGLVSKLTSLEQAYLAAFLRFISTELWYSKVGDGQYSKGQSALWNKEDLCPNDDCDTIDELLVKENYIDDEQNPRIVFQRKNISEFTTFNFRRGDICVLYPKNEGRNLATHGQVLKCTLSKELNSDGELELNFQYRQNEQCKSSLFKPDISWAIEHDSMDHNFHSMYRGIFKFLSASLTKRSLLLGVTPPSKYELEEIEAVLPATTANESSRKEQNQLISKAIASNEYFLIIGPPGTGKTKILLKHLVGELYKKENHNILVLAYTNKAVDEICEAISDSSVSEGLSNQFIRIGSRLGCNTIYHRNLLDSIASACANRTELSGKIKSTRIFISTISSIVGKQDLFRLKNFDTVIVDEASQILEPQIIGLLSQFPKFILIGDSKQLPAVSLQSKQEATRFNSKLESIGFVDLRESYFERLIRLSKKNDWSHSFGMLRYQGRMHEDIATFPNNCFYGNQLKIAERPHQTGPLKGNERTTELSKFIAKRRLIYIPSTQTSGDNNKVNENEAKATAVLIQEIINHRNRSNLEFDPELTIGVITPYRNQIAHIRRELEVAKIPNWERITVDTVERFQGGQRDVIIFSVCVNSVSQLEFLGSNVLYDEESEELVDRKLNVALTRAREQLIVLGNPYYLFSINLYHKLIHFISSKGGVIEEGANGIINGEVKFNQEYDLEKLTVENGVWLPSQKFTSVFNRIIVEVIKLDKRTTAYPDLVLGYDSNYNRNVVLEHGRADFSAGLITHSPADRVLLYCFYNMRKHYFSQLAILGTFKQEFLFRLSNSKDRFTMIDWGCGPATSLLATEQFLTENKKDIISYYIGIDRSQEMLTKGKEFIDSDLFDSALKYKLVNHLSQVNDEELNNIFRIPTLCLLNFSYFFGNVNNTQAKALAMDVLNIIKKYPLNKYIIVYQNSSLEGRNASYNLFKKVLAQYSEISTKTEVIKYKNNEFSYFESSEKVYYEILELN